MVAIVRLKGYEKLVYMRHFSEKAAGRRTGGNSNPNSYQEQRENPMFFKFAQRGVLLSEWHICSIIGFKGHTGAIFCDTGQTESGI
jgi:hypothetical protein